MSNNSLNNEFSSTVEVDRMEMISPGCIPLMTSIANNVAFLSYLHRISKLCKQTKCNTNEYVGGNSVMRCEREISWGKLWLWWCERKRDWLREIWYEWERQRDIVIYCFKSWLVQKQRITHIAQINLQCHWEKLNNPWIELSTFIFPPCPKEPSNFINNQKKKKHRRDRGFLLFWVIK